MSPRRKRIIAIVLLAGAATLALLVLMPLRGCDQWSDKNAAIGVYFNPFTLLNVHASSAHYIRVAGVRYNYHDGLAPGYLIVPELNAMLWQTMDRPFDGDYTLHVRDLASGQVTNMHGNKRAFVVEEVSHGGTNARVWIQERTGDVITLASFTRNGYGACLAFAAFDLSKGMVTESQRFDYSAPDNYLPEVYDLVGKHWADAGLDAPPPTK